MATQTVHKSAKNGRFNTKAAANRSKSTIYKTRVSTPKRGKK